MPDELVRERRAKFLHFRNRNRHKPFNFLAKLFAEDVFSVKNPMGRRQFHTKTDGPEAMHVSGPGQNRDLANPLGIELLSP